MNQFRIWQYLLIFSIILIGIIYAIPNFFPSKPALQIALGGSTANERVIIEVSEVLDRNNINYSEILLQENSVKVVLDNVEDQLASRRLIADYSDGDYIIALNSEPTTPDWLRNIGGNPLNLGLDLAGGIHFLLEVDTKRYSIERISSESASIEDELKRQGLAVTSSTVGSEAYFSFTNSEDLEAAKGYLNDNNFTISGNKFNILQNGLDLTLVYTDSFLSEIIDYAVEQNLVALRNRVNELGVSEPIVQREGKGRIVVELPGVQDSASAKKIIGKTANLEFRLEALSLIHI